MQKSAVLAVLMACFGGVALAQAPSSSLLLRAGAQATVRPAEQQYNGPTQVPLLPGDQACVTAGSATLTSSGVRRVLKTGTCYQLPAPRSLLSSLAAMVSSWLPSSRKAGTANAESRGSRKGREPTVPTIALPSDYPLSSLQVPINRPPNPRTLRVFGAANELLYSAEQAEPDVGFTVPVSFLKTAGRLEVINAFGKIVYSGPVQWVDFPGQRGGTPADFTERAQQLLDTGLTEYLLPVYSLFIEAGETEAAHTLLTNVIIVCYSNPG